MKKLNSASRVLDLLSKARTHQDKDKIFNVWSDVFEIDEKNRDKKNREISRCLGLLDDEVNIIQKEMGLSTYDEFGCETLLESLNGLFAVHIIMGEWGPLNQKLTKEVFLCLGYCREVIPDEKILINEDDIEEIYQLIDSLTTQLQTSTLPTYTVNIIKNHINSILGALHSYKIVGAAPLQEAMKAVVGEVIANDEVFTQAKGSEEIGVFGKLFKKVHTVTDGFVKTEKFLTSGEKIIKHGTKALEVIESLT